MDCTIDYEIKKRLPPRLPKRKSDIYVTKKTNFTCQILKCQKLLDDGENEIIIHGLGAAINRAISLALELVEKSGGSLKQVVRTSTVELTDDLQPLVDDKDYDSRNRNNSAVHIRVYKLFPKD